MDFNMLLTPPGVIVIRRVCWFVRSVVHPFVDIFERMTRKRLEIEARFLWTTDRKWHIANQMFT